MTSTRTATGAPDDQVAEFNLNAVQAESNLAPFRFLWAGKDDPNRRLTMAHLEALDVWPLMAAADGGDAAAMTGIFREALGKDQWAEFRKTPLPQYKLKALFAAYREHSGTEAGESAASSGS